MVTITKREALEITARLWNWLAENPKAEKLNWPEHGKYNFMSDCACCQYDYQQRHARPNKYRICSCCPLNDYVWRNEQQCYNHGQVFADWREQGRMLEAHIRGSHFLSGEEFIGVISTRKALALQIRNGALNALKDLDLEEAEVEAEARAEARKESSDESQG